MLAYKTLIDATLKNLTGRFNLFHLSLIEEDRKRRKRRRRCLYSVKKWKLLLLSVTSSPLLIGRQPAEQTVRLTSTASRGEGGVPTLHVEMILLDVCCWSSTRREITDPRNS